MPDLVESLAAHCHDNQWSGWMRYLFAKCTTNSDGPVTIPAESAARWRYQVGTPYSELPEDMRESDRAEARAILRVIESEQTVGGAQ